MFCQFDCFVSRCVPLGFVLHGTLHFLYLVDYFPSHVREFFSYYFFKYFLRSFLSLFSFRDSYKVNVGVFKVVLEFFPGDSAGRESACNAGDQGSTTGLGRSPGKGNGYPFQCSGLENCMDCVVYGVTKESDTIEQLSLFLRSLTVFHFLAFFFFL